MALDALKIQNFQAHEALTLEFAPGVTTLVGPSDAGKSAILRALRWVATNRPRGEAHIRRGADFCRVGLKVDGHTITRRRGKLGNIYKLDGEEYKAFADGVPEAISGLLRLDEVNFQGQHDAPYWFGLTPGEVARQINAIVDLGIIDEAQERLAAKARRAKAEADVVADRLKAARREVEALAFVPEMSAAYEAAQAAEDDAAKKAAHAAACRRLVDSATAAGDKARTTGDAATAAGGVLAAIREARKARAEADALAGMIRQMSVAEARAAAPVPDISALEAAYADAREKRREVTRLRGMMERATAAADNLSDRMMRAEKAEKKLADESGGQCPMCGGPLRV